MTTIDIGEVARGFDAVIFRFDWLQRHIYERFRANCSQIFSIESILEMPCCYVGGLNDE